MVKVIEKEADRVTSKLFLLSVKKWHNEEGLHMGIERISNLYANKNDKNKRGISVTASILDDMPKCRVRKIENGKVVKKEDEDTGEMKDAIEIVDDVTEVTFFFNVSVKGLTEEEIENGDFIVNNKASCFPLFNFGFIATGDLPEDNTKGFICNIDELKSALKGIEFLAKEKDESFDGGKPYQVLIPSPYMDVEDLSDE